VGAQTVKADIMTALMVHIITIMAILRTITQMGNVPIPTHRAEDAQQGKPPEL
jgi:hypothetical protein